MTRPGGELERSDNLPVPRRSVSIASAASEMRNLEDEPRDHPPGSLQKAIVGGPPGQCRLSFHDDGIFVDRADPVVWMEDGFLHDLVSAAGKKNGWVSLTFQPYDLCEPPVCCQVWRGGRCFLGAVVAIWGKNAHVMYRVTRFRRGVWEAKFP